MSQRSAVVGRDRRRIPQIRQGPGRRLPHPRLRITQARHGESHRTPGTPEPTQSVDGGGADPHFLIDQQRGEQVESSGGRQVGQRPGGGFPDAPVCGLQFRLQNGQCLRARQPSYREQGGQIGETLVLESEDLP